MILFLSKRIILPPFLVWNFNSFLSMVVYDRVGFSGDIILLFNQTSLFIALYLCIYNAKVLCAKKGDFFSADGNTGLLTIGKGWIC